MSTIGDHQPLRDGMLQLRREFPEFAAWPLLAIEHHVQWAGLMDPEWLRLRGARANDNRLQGRRRDQLSPTDYTT